MGSEVEYRVRWRWLYWFLWLTGLPPTYVCMYNQQPRPLVDIFPWVLRSQPFAKHFVGRCCICRHFMSAGWQNVMLFLTQHATFLFMHAPAPRPQKSRKQKAREAPEVPKTTTIYVATTVPLLWSRAALSSDKYRQRSSVTPRG